MRISTNFQEKILNRLYGETDPELTYTVADGGIVGDDTPEAVLTGGLTRDRAGETDGENAGTYAIEQGTLATTAGAGANYTIYSYVGASLTINKAPAPESLSDKQKPTAKELTYNGQAQELVTAPLSPPVGYTLQYSTDGGMTWSEEIPKGTDASTDTDPLHGRIQIRRRQQPYQFRRRQN